MKYLVFAMMFVFCNVVTGEGTNEPSVLSIFNKPNRFWNQEKQRYEPKPVFYWVVWTEHVPRQRAGFWMLNRSVDDIPAQDIIRINKFKTLEEVELFYRGFFSKKSVEPVYSYDESGDGIMTFSFESTERDGEIHGIFKGTKLSFKPLFKITKTEKTIILETEEKVFLGVEVK